MPPWFTQLTTFLTNPVLGVPVLLIAAAVLMCVVLRPRSLLPLRARGTREVPPSDDAVSRIHRAVEAQENSALVEVAWTHLDNSVRRRFRVGINEIPWRTARAERMGISGSRRLR